MKILDKYILRNFFSLFICLTVGLTLLICLISYVVEIFVLENYYASSVSFFEMMFVYFLRVSSNFNILLPLFAFVSTVFTVWKMSDRSEVTACLSIGETFNRFLKPIFVASVFLMKIMIVCEGWVIPAVYREMENCNYRFFGEGINASGRNIYFALGNGRYMSIKYFNKFLCEGEDVMIFKSEGNKFLYCFYAKKMCWDDHNKGNWVFYNWEKRIFTDGDDVVTKGDEIASTEKDIHLTPNDFIFDDNFQNKLNRDQLNEVTVRLAKHKVNNKIFKIEQVKRCIRPMMIVLVMMAGAISCSMKRRNKNVSSIIVGACISAFVIVSSIVSEGFAIYTNWNMYALFFVPIVISVCSVYLFYRNVIKN